MKKEVPAERESQRYLRFKIHSESQVELGEAVEAFWKAAEQYMGVRDLSDAEPWFIANKYSQEKQAGVIRVNREYEKDLRASLTFVDDIGDQDGFFFVEEISGSLRGL